MSGPRNPYPGKVGVIEPNAYADLLLVDGEPALSGAVHPPNGKKEDLADDVRKGHERHRYNIAFDEQ